MSRSSLRFTWEYATPAWLACPEGEAGGRAREGLVVIGGGGALPESLGERLRGLRLSRAFREHEGVFALRVEVWVFTPEEATRP